MGKLFMLAILLLFSVEDIRFKSISEKWFWGLAVFVFLMLFIPPLWTIPGHHSLLSPNLIHFFLVNTGAYFFGDFAKSLSNSLFSSFPFIYFSDLSWFTYWDFYFYIYPISLQEKKGLEKVISCTLRLYLFYSPFQRFGFLIFWHSSLGASGLSFFSCLVERKIKPIFASGKFHFFLFCQ
jgi:hypothetical protein